MNNNEKNNPSSQGSLMRYGSAPTSVLDAALDIDSFIAPLQRSSNNYTSSSSSQLIRHSSSPAGFFNDYLPPSDAEAGFSITRGIGNNYNSKGIAEDDKQGVSRMNSRLSFSHSKESLSRISEEIENNADSDTHDNNTKARSSRSNNTSTCFTMGLWENDNNHPLTFSVSPTKQPKNSNTMDNMESQFQFGMSQGALEFMPMDKFMNNIPQDSVPCKIRAKRGCATHPRSIAERERRTRISGKLKKLQDLVPNMDKQTSYADMLDLAVQHIKSLQNQVQQLNDELDGCTCGCKKTTTF
ncbi:basic helix-loop-helix (bHLH) DNA-bindingsuperfamily protein [Striga asiatica]|uniref:Basic helix-loop-helix (BHLH) DNA-bindingsuperfamily protein n=1 Tax=Striga asiatica TaxID=4170 RepID=A0A5A7P5N6_STRAF|nr:basic helix-loop-helix (bHLH) DNA-bindingsuperfamily protein [Striga asiatica]